MPFRGVDSTGRKRLVVRQLCRFSLAGYPDLDSEYCHAEPASPAINTPSSPPNIPHSLPWFSTLATGCPSHSLRPLLSAQPILSPVACRHRTTYERTATDDQVIPTWLCTVYAIYAVMGQIPEPFPPPFGNTNDIVRHVTPQLRLSVTSLTFCFQAVMECRRFRLQHRVGPDLNGTLGPELWQRLGKALKATVCGT